MDDLQSKHPAFRGNWDDLKEFELLASSPVRSQAREDALQRWEKYRLSKRSASTSKRAAIRRVLTSQTNLRGANLSEICIGYADLRGVSFDGANLKGAWLKGANLQNASLQNVDFSANVSGRGRGPGRLLFANLSGADLTNADLRGVDLSYTNLNGADLTGVDLTDADLSRASLVGTTVEDSVFRNTHVYGISTWDIKGKPRLQQDLIITPAKTLGEKKLYQAKDTQDDEGNSPSDEMDEAFLTVDNLEMAQFIYLLLNNKNVRYIIDTITSKTVLILGRFTSERKKVLDGIREELRRLNFTPILFDFEKPASKDLTGTVETLSRMARFIIADLTDPSSIPHELATIVPFLRSTPILPIRLKGTSGYSMFDDLKAYPWVMERYDYEDTSSLLSSIPEIIAPIKEKADSLLRN